MREVRFRHYLLHDLSENIGGIDKIESFIGSS